MGPDALIERLAARRVTPVTPAVAAGVTPKPAPILAVTSVTHVTSREFVTERGATGAALDRCAGCVHHARPGRADSGYCSARTDLPHVYGLLHRLPLDGSASCSAFRESGAGADRGSAP
jgi:hypothetical protein